MLFAFRLSCKWIRKYKVFSDSARYRVRKCHAFLDSYAIESENALNFRTRYTAKPEILFISMAIKSRSITSFFLFQYLWSTLIRIWNRFLISNTTIISFNLIIYYFYCFFIKKLYQRNIFYRGLSTYRDKCFMFHKQILFLLLYVVEVVCFFKVMWNTDVIFKQV